jgi:hypothetical protein
MGYEELDYGDVILVGAMELPLEELVAEEEETEPAVPPPTPEEQEEIDEEMEEVETDIGKATEVGYGRTR